MKNRTTEPKKKTASFLFLPFPSYRKVVVSLLSGVRLDAFYAFARVWFAPYVQAPTAQGKSAMLYHRPGSTAKHFLQLHLHTSTTHNIDVQSALNRNRVIVRFGFDPPSSTSTTALMLLLQTGPTLAAFSLFRDTLFVLVKCVGVCVFRCA